ncbi:MAG: hypothetical protein U5N26_07295 [Candidatus Marinimicrobia bacterium]|nr:hypothetical protein [Candidatus Neomarinimicrobiota bacterium]
MGGVYPLGGWKLNFNVKWADGGKAVMRTDPITGAQQKADIVDYTSTDMKAGKRIQAGNHYLELSVRITNLFNQKRLYIGGMSNTQYNNYVESLKLPFEEGEEHGDDKWGEWDKEHIDTGWFEAPIFLNPRRITLNLSVDI